MPGSRCTTRARRAPPWLSTQPSWKPPFFTLPFRTASMILKAHLGVHALGDEKEHDVVAAAHGLQNRGRAADRSDPGRCPATRRCRGRSRTAAPGCRNPLGWVSTSICRVKRGAELRDGHGAGGTQQLVILIAQHLGGGERCTWCPGRPGGCARALTPVRSSSMRIMVGSSWPSISSFRRLSSMQWYSKWVVTVSASSGHLPGAARR